jgi:hypothetical protein
VAKSESDLFAHQNLFRCQLSICHFVASGGFIVIAKSRNTRINGETHVTKIIDERQQVLPNTTDSKWRPMNIKKQRRMAGRLSQIELARLSGVSRFRISLAESGHIALRTEEREAIDQAVASEVQRLAKGFQKPEID